MKIARIALLATSSALALGYENDTGWKKNDDGSLVTDSDGNPVYVGSDGKEQTVAPGYINRLNTEAATHRKAAKDAQDRLAAFGDLDPKEAKAAVSKLKDVDFDSLVNKGEIESVRTQMREQFEQELADRETKLTEANQRLERLALDNAFNSSEFLNTRLALPVDAARATFRDRFKVDGDKVVPLDSTGNPLINKHGDVASVDEAFQTFIEGRTDKDVWLKAPEVGGSGSQGAGGGHGGGNRVKRSDFEAMAPMDQAAIGKKVAAGEVQLVD